MVLNDGSLLLVEAEQIDMDSPSELNINAEELVQALRRKEGTWVSWGQACQQLQKVGYNSQSIFEETGFEPIHQNQVIVGSQVYQTLIKAEVNPEVLQHFELKGSDILYELRVLNQQERAAAATYILDKGLDIAGVQELVKAFKEFSLSPKKVPEAFTKVPGDILAYRCWKLARQQNDLQVRSRLIAQGLKSASSQAARQTVEQLLTDFSIVQEKPAPSLPIYRLESETELPRILPYLGKFPLSPSVLETVTPLQETGPFRFIHSQQQQQWVALPGWKIIFQAQMPLAFSCEANALPTVLSDVQDSELLVLVDYAQQEWNVNSYFLVAVNNQLQIRWFETQPQSSLLGQILVVIRPKKILDEDYNKKLWVIDE